MDEPNTTTTTDNAAAAPTSQSQSITHQPNLPLILAVATLLIMLLVGILMLTGFGRTPAPSTPAAVAPPAEESFADRAARYATEPELSPEEIAAFEARVGDLQPTSTELSDGEVADFMGRASLYAN